MYRQMSLCLVLACLLCGCQALTPGGNNVATFAELSGAVNRLPAAAAAQQIAYPRGCRCSLAWSCGSCTRQQ